MHENSTSFAETHSPSERSLLLKTPDPSVRCQRFRRPASKARKLAVLTSCVVQLTVLSGIGYSLSVMYAELVIAFDAKRAEAALIQSLYVGLYSATGIGFVGMIKRFGLGTCIVVGCILSTIGLFASAFARDLVTIILCTGVLAGVTTGVCYLATFVTTGLMFTEQASFYLISITIGNSLGQFIGPLLMEVFIAQYSWPGAFVLIAGISLQCVPCGIVIHYSRKYFERENVGSKKTSNAFCDKALLTDGLLWVILSNAFLNAVTGNVETWFIVDHVISRGLTRESGSIMVSLTGVGNCVGRVVGATLRFRFTNFSTLNHWIYLCAINGCFHAVIINLYDDWSIMITCFLFGISYGTTVAQSPAIMFEATGLERYPQGMGLFNIVIGVANIIGPLIGGFIKDTLGTYDVSFYIATAAGWYIGLVTLFVAIFTERRKRRKEIQTLHVKN